MIQCAFKEINVKLPNGQYRSSTCINKAEILYINDPCYGLCYTCAYKKLKAELDKHRWIPVGERLPENNIDVLVVNSDGVRVAYYDSGSYVNWYNESDSCGCCDTFDDKVTHWKPIILPEKETEK